MKLDVFTYSSYKKYLRDRLDIDGQELKGIRKKLADYIGCQPSYISQVLGGKPHLMLEQADKINSFFSHNEDEEKYFLFMVESERAGTQTLKKFFNDQMNLIRKERTNLKKRLKNTEDISENDQHIYYSTWYYAAIHVIISIPGFQDLRKISQHLNLPINIVTEVIQFLERTGLIVLKDGIYNLTKKSFYLGRESIFIQRHHINWRSQSLFSIEKNMSDDLHYSNVIAISTSDYKKIKELFIQTIENSRKIIGPSKEENLYAITLDIFNL